MVMPLTLAVTRVAPLAKVNVVDVPPPVITCVPAIRVPLTVKLSVPAKNAIPVVNPEMSSVLSAFTVTDTLFVVRFPEPVHRLGVPLKTIVLATPGVLPALMKEPLLTRLPLIVRF